MSQSDTRLFVGRLGRDVRQRDLEDLFNRYGTIKNCSLKSTYGFVEFEDPRDARDALALDGTELEGSRIVVEFSRGRRDRGDPRDRRGGYGDRYDRDGYRDRERDRYRDRPPSRFRNTEYRCIIEDLPSGCSWQDLKDHFRTVGDVCFADVRRERGGRDYGIVEFKYEDDLQRAVDELDRSRIRGTQIRVISDYKAGDRRRSRSRDRDSRSPRRSPRRSPGGRSPARSPGGGSPRRDSPRRDSPRRDSPRRDSPRRDSPRRDSRSPVRRSRSTSR